MINEQYPPTLQSHTVQQRQDYRREREAQLARWRADLYSLDADVKQDRSPFDIDFQKNLDAMKPLLMQMQERLEELKDATGDAWDEMKAEIDDAWQELAGAMEEIRPK